MMRFIRAGLFLLLAAPAIAADRAQPPLTAQETAILAGHLKRAEPGFVTVVCGSADCKPLASGVVALFQNAKWRVKTIWHGGLGIDGVQNIRVNSCGGQANGIAAALRDATPRKIEVIDDGKCPDGEKEIFVVVGPPA